MPRFCSRCPTGSGKLHNHPGAHILDLTDRRYEVVPRVGGGFKRRRDGSQWQYYCMHHRQTSTCDECTKASKESPNISIPRKKHCRVKTTVHKTPCSSEKDSHGRSTNGKRRFIKTSADGSKHDNESTAKKKRKAGPSAEEKRAVKFRNSPKAVPASLTNGSKGGRPWQDILRYDPIVNADPIGLEKKLVPRWTPVGALNLAGLSESAGFSTFTHLMVKYEKAKYSVEMEDKICEFIHSVGTGKRRNDFDYYKIGPYSLYHFVRTWLFWKKAPQRLEGRPWQPMSENGVTLMIDQLKVEGYMTPHALYSALDEQQGLSVRHVNNQFDLQLMLCEFSSLCPNLKRTDLSFIKKANFMDTYVACGHGNLDEVYLGGKQIFIQHEKLHGSFPTLVSGEKDNTYFEIIVVLLLSNCSLKFANLGNAADVRGFVEAANVLTEKKHKQQSLMKFLFIVHQLWVPSRMLAFAAAVEKRKR